MLFTVNCSILLAEIPLLERAAAARRHGFEAVEFWWPFAQAVPAADDVAAFESSILDAGVQLTGLNFFAGDMAAGDRGILSDPSRQVEFLRNIEVVASIGERLGCRMFNAIYGNRVASLEPARQDETARSNLARASAVLNDIGGTVLLEPLSGDDTFPLRTIDEAVAIIRQLHEEADATNVRVLADLYHLGRNDGDVTAALAANAADIGHIQIADSPGRGHPGTGTLPLGHWLTTARDNGYRGYVGLEYIPSDAAEPFAWLPEPQRGHGIPFDPRVLS